MCNLRKRKGKQLGRWTKWKKKVNKKPELLSVLQRPRNKKGELTRGYSAQAWKIGKEELLSAYVADCSGPGGNFILTRGETVASQRCRIPLASVLATHIVPFWSKVLSVRRLDTVDGSELIVNERTAEKHFKFLILMCRTTFSSPYAYIYVQIWKRNRQKRPYFFCWVNRWQWLRSWLYLLG